ncbi:MAG: molybdopterin-dependent oxidoreductase [Desulfobacteraceae bacterium]
MDKGAICVKGLASLEYLNHPDRLKYPLRRKGGRGNGEWEQISWDEALDTVAEELTRAKDAYGPESLIFMRGSFKGGYQGTHLTRFANAFGAPNIASMASVCYVPRVNGSMITHGYNPVPASSRAEICCSPTAMPSRCGMRSRSWIFWSWQTCL